MLATHRLQLPAPKVPVSMVAMQTHKTHTHTRRSDAACQVLREPANGTGCWEADQQLSRSGHVTGIAIDEMRLGVVGAYFLPDLYGGDALAHVSGSPTLAAQLIFYKSQ